MSKIHFTAPTKPGNKSALFDPDLPTANTVMASLCCVAAQYAKAPSFELAVLASSLANTLTAPEYAETELIVSVAKRLVVQWHAVLIEHQQLEKSGLEIQAFAGQSFKACNTLQ